MSVGLSCESWKRGFKKALEPFHNVGNDEKINLILTFWLYVKK